MRSLDVGEGGRRQQRLGGGVLGVDGAPAISLPQLWVVQHLVESLDLCGGNTRRRQAGVEFGCGPAPASVTPTMASHSRAIPYPCHIGGEAGSSANSGASKTSVTSVRQPRSFCTPIRICAVAGRVGVVGGDRSCGSGPSAVAGLPVCICVYRAWPIHSTVASSMDDVDRGALAGARTGAAARRGPPGRRTCPAAMSAVGMPVLAGWSGVPVIEMRPASAWIEHVVGLALLDRAARARIRTC